MSISCWPACQGRPLFVQSYCQESSIATLGFRPCSQHDCRAAWTVIKKPPRATLCHLSSVRYRSRLKRLLFYRPLKRLVFVKVRHADDFDRTFLGRLNYLSRTVLKVPVEVIR